MPKPAQQYLFVAFFIFLTIITSLFTPKSAEAWWSLDTESPFVDAQFTCANRNPFGDNIFYAYRLFQDSFFNLRYDLFSNYAGNVQQISGLNNQIICLPFPDKTILLDVSCSDITGCERMNYNINGCRDRTCTDFDGNGEVGVTIPHIQPSNPIPISCGGNYVTDPYSVYGVTRRYSQPQQKLDTKGYVSFRASIYDTIDCSGNKNEKYASSDLCEDIATGCMPLPGQIDGTVFIDVNRNGAFDAGTDSIYGGAQITLSGGPTAKPPTTSSSSPLPGKIGNENYEFTLLDKGDYTVTIGNIPPGYELTTPNSQSRFAGIATANFGISPTHTVSGRIFSDADNSGTISAGDPLFIDTVSPADVQLTGTQNPGIGVNRNASTTNGNYSFTLVKNGTYTMTLATPAGYKQVFVPQASIDRITNANLPTATAPQTITNVDLLVQGFTVCGCDCDANGVCPPSPNNSTGGLYLDYDDNNSLNIPPDQQFAGANGIVTPVNLLNAAGTQVRTTNTNGSGQFVFYNLKAGTYYVAPPLPAGYKQIRALDFPDVDTARSRITIVNADIDNLRFLVRGWTIEGHVSVDYNHNAANDAPGDEYYNGITLSLSEGYNTRPPVTTSTIPLKGVGYYRFTGLRGGPVGYVVTLNDTVTGFTTDYPANNGDNTTINPRSNIQLGNSEPWLAQFTMTPLYSISGNIFIDENKDLFKGGDANYTASQLTIQIRGTNPTNNTILRQVPLNINTVTGAYDSGPILISGKYTVEHTTFPLPDGFLPTYPDAGRPYAFDVWIGTHLNSVGTLIPPVSGYRCIDTLGPPALHNDADCWQAPSTPYNGSIQNVNFGISDSIPWYQGQGGDIRADRGVSDPIPDPKPGDVAACIKRGNIITGSSTTAGVWFSGDSSWDFCASVDSCKDRANNNTNPADQWVVGGTGDTKAKYSPRVNGALSTEHGVLLNIATTNNITVNNGIPGCVNPATTGCTIPANLPNGVYRVQSNMVLNTSTVGQNHDYVFLIDGDLRITGNVIVPVGSTAIFSARNDIFISATVGQAATIAGSSTNCSIVDPTNDLGNHPGCNVEGIYSANRNFVIEGSGKLGCQASGVRDSRINIAGVVIANALLSSNGGFSNQRDTCTDNLFCPTYAIKDRPDFILNAPEFLKYKNYLWKEVAP